MSSYEDLLHPSPELIDVVVHGKGSKVRLKRSDLKDAETLRVAISRESAEIRASLQEMRDEIPALEANHRKQTLLSLKWKRIRPSLVTAREKLIEAMERYDNLYGDYEFALRLQGFDSPPRVDSGISPRELAEGTERLYRRYRR